jgi:hypothetical protein
MSAFPLGHRDLACVIKVRKHIGNFSEATTTGLALNPQRISKENSEQVNTDAHGTP